jgi:hypothetical protein
MPSSDFCTCSIFSVYASSSEYRAGTVLPNLLPLMNKTSTLRVQAMFVLRFGALQMKRAVPPSGTS